MATTEQVRIWYREMVANHADRGKAGYKPVCDWRTSVRVSFPREGGGHFSEPVHPKTVEAWKAYIAVMVFHGETMPGAGGVDQCRNIANSAWPSLHAYLVAVDLPPNSRKSDAFIRDIERIRTRSGARVFRNLAGDRMHDQLDCSPADLATGIDWRTVRQQEDDMSQFGPEHWDAADVAAFRTKVGPIVTDYSVGAPFGGPQGSPNRKPMTNHVLDLKTLVGALDLEGVSEAELDERVEGLAQVIHAQPAAFIAKLKAAL